MANISAWYRDVLRHVKQRLRTPILRFLNDGIGLIRQTAALRPNGDHDRDAPLGGSLTDDDRQACDLSASPDDSSSASINDLSGTSKTRFRPPAGSSGTLELRSSDRSAIAPSSSWSRKSHKSHPSYSRYRTD